MRPLAPQPIELVPGRVDDRERVGRIRPPREMAAYVHYNWFWLDRSLADPAISFDLVRSGPRRRLVGVVAYGPHETRDQDPASRIADCGEIFHVVVDRLATRRGYGHAIVGAAIRCLLDANPACMRLRIGHHPDNQASARLFAAFGFRQVGIKEDHETGTRDVLMEAARGELASRILSTGGG